jgi:hypothetical protein
MNSEIENISCEVSSESRDDIQSKESSNNYLLYCLILVAVVIVIAVGYNTMVYEFVWLNQKKQTL